MRRAGRIVHAALDAAEAACVPGATALDVDAAANSVIIQSGGTSLFKGYAGADAGQSGADGRPGEGFPGHVCVSVNEAVVHGVPGSRVLQDGDVVTVDCGVRLDGWCGDAARTIRVGRVPPDADAMIRCAQRVLAAAIEMMRPGRAWSEIGRRMQAEASEPGFGVVQEYVGHGIGRSLHEPPQTPAFSSASFERERDFTLRPGMVLAVEPMLTLGEPQTRVLDDGWSVVTVDGRLACHVEHTVAVTRNGADVLTDGR